MEEVKKSVLSIEEIKKEILNIELLKQDDGISYEIKNRDTIEGLFEDNYETISEVILNECKDGKKISEFFSDFFEEDDVYAPVKALLLDGLFNEVEKKKGNDASADVGGQPKLSESGDLNGAEGDQKPQDVSADVEGQTVNTQEQPQEPSTGKTTDVGQQPLQQQDKEEVEEIEQINMKGLLETVMSLGASITAYSEVNKRLEKNIAEKDKAINIYKMGITNLNRVIDRCKTVTAQLPVQVRLAPMKTYSNKNASFDVERCLQDINLESMINVGHNRILGLK